MKFVWKCDHSVTYDLPWLTIPLQYPAPSAIICQYQNQSSSLACLEVIVGSASEIFVRVVLWTRRPNSIFHTKRFVQTVDFQDTIALMLYTKHVELRVKQWGVRYILLHVRGASPNHSTYLVTDFFIFSFCEPKEHRTIPAGTCGRWEFSESLMAHSATNLFPATEGVRCLMIHSVIGHRLIYQAKALKRQKTGPHLR